MNFSTTSARLHFSTFTAPYRAKKRAASVRRNLRGQEGTGFLILNESTIKRFVDLGRNRSGPLVRATFIAGELQSLCCAVVNRDDDALGLAFCLVVVGKALLLPITIQAPVNDNVELVAL